MENNSSAKEIFFAALEQRSPQDLASYLKQACGNDAELRQQVEQLLRAHDQAGRFLGGPETAAPTIDGAVTFAPSQIGPYKLLQQIGEGGMGVVYLAEQTASVHRQVALKIIKPGMDSRQVIARFEAERQALALMDAFHPDVVLLDLGMPNLNGFDTCRRIRELPWGRSVMIVALTGWGSPEDRRRTNEAGFDHHFIKPVEYASLMQVLDGSA